jgi:tetratricopeptide (TPR) repeat protein
MRRRFRQLLVGTLVLCAADAARAAPGAEADATERARKLYELGAEAFAAQHNADAIGYFRRAAALVPSAKLTYNIGLAYEEMGDSGRALGEYRDYLRQEPAGERRRDVEKRIATLERRLAATGLQHLSITSDPPGATVRIGGRAVGVTPWAGELAPGPHEVELTLSGHGPQRALVTLAADHSSELALELTPEHERARGLDTRPESQVSPLAWTFLGVGAAALTGGIAFELSRASSSAAAERTDTPLAAAEARGAADAKQMASLLLLGFGAGFLVGGGVLLALDLTAANEPASEPRRAVTSLACQPAFCGVLAHGHFYTRPSNQAQQPGRRALTCREA